MANKILHNPKAIGIIYLLLIPMFAFVYWWNPQFWTKPLSIIQSIYFSVVTITTLGYGDIVPRTEQAQILAALEALLGIVTIGFFLNSVARHQDDIRESRRKEILRGHLLAQYGEYRQELVRLCLRAASVNNDVDPELEENLVDYKRFREYFTGNNRQRWYDVLNGLEANKDVFEDILVVVDLFIQQVSYALGNILVENKKALAILTRVVQQPYKIKHLDVYADDPVKYFGAFVFEIMAMWSIINGYLDYDFIEDSIRCL